MVWVPSAFTSTTRLFSVIGDEDIARAVHRHASGLREPGTDGGLGTVGLHLHHRGLEGIGDEDVAEAVHRHRQRVR